MGLEFVVWLSCFFRPRSRPLGGCRAIVVWIVGALESAVVVGGLSALGAGLFSVGIPKNSILKYETEIKNGKYVLIAHGTAQEAARARDIISGSNSESHWDHMLSATGT